MYLAGLICNIFTIVGIILTEFNKSRILSGVQGDRERGPINVTQ